MPSLRAAARVTLNSSRLLATAAAVTLAEITLRVLLGWAVHPVLALLVPPVAAVVGLGLLAPGVRGALSAGPPVELPASGTKARVSPLVAVTFLGHAVAVALGAAAFLVVDTPVRAALYWLGYGDVLTPIVLLVSPLWGVAAGTLVAWAVPALAVVRVAAGESVRRSFAAALAAVVRTPRDVARGVGWHLGFAGAASFVVGVAVRYGVDFGSPVLLVGVAGSLTFLVSTFALAFLAAFHAGRPDADGTAATNRLAPAIPVARATMAVLVLAGLVAAAGAVRTAELRPTDAASEPLPDDPGGAYATAFENTERASHAYRVAIETDGEPFVVEHRIDRAERQYRQIPSGRAAGPSVYAATGTGSPPLGMGTDSLSLAERDAGDGRIVRASPDYVQWESRYSWNRTGGLTPPSPDVDGWEYVDRRGDEIVVELTDPVRVFAAAQVRVPDEVTHVNASRIRAVIDADRGTLSEVEFRLDANVVLDGREYHYDGRTVHRFEVDVDVKRPEALGAPSVGERLWRLFVY